MLAMERILEDLLVKEGLHELIRQSRRPLRFKPPGPMLTFFILAVLWAAAILVEFSSRGPGFWLALLTPLPIILISLLAWFLVVRIWRRRAGRNLDPREERFASILILLLIFPILLSVSLGIYLASLRAGATFFVLAIVTLGLILLIQPFGYVLHLVKRNIELAATSFSRSQNQLGSMFPILLLIVVFSVFSRGFWQVVGNAPLSNLIIASVLIAAPAVFLAVRNRGILVKELVPGIPSIDAVFRTARKEPFISQHLERSTISVEEWAEAENQFRWRHKNKLEEFVLPVISRKVGRHIGLLLAFNGILLFLAFSAFFLVLNSLLIAPAALNLWIGDQYDFLLAPLRGIPSVGSVQIALPVLEASLFLSVIVVTIATVNSFTRADLKSIFSDWLRAKAEEWIATSAIYRSISSPNYQVWKYLRKDRGTGIATVWIVVKNGLPDDEIKAACDHMLDRLGKSRKYVQITAFEQTSSKPRYQRGVLGRRWQLTHSLTMEVPEFEDISILDVEYRFQHLVGFEAQKDQSEIQPEWFGNSDRAQALGRDIWDTNQQPPLVMHPYVYDEGESVFLEIYLTRRMSPPNGYRRLVKRFLAVSRNQISPAPTNITLYFRDTVEVLASLDLNEDPSFAIYSDEFGGSKLLNSYIFWQG